MDVRAREDVAAAAGVHTELGQEYDGAVAEGLVERISSEIDKQVDARLAQRGIQPSVAAWTNLAMGLGSIGLGIAATAVTLQSWSSSGVAPKSRSRSRLIPGIPSDGHQVGEHHRGDPDRTDLGRHCRRQRRLRPPPFRSVLSGTPTPQLV
jgi:hypothetical protein